jgi:CHASE3 domain sensor protein
MRILWIFEFIIVTIISVAIGSFYQNLLTDSTKAVAHTNEVIDTIDDMFILVLRSESAVKSYSTFGSQLYLDYYNRAKDDYPLMIYRLQNMVDDNPKQIQNVSDFNAAVMKKKDFLDDVVQHKQDNTLQTYQGQVKGKELMDNVKAVYDEMKDEEYKVLKIRTNQLNWYANNSIYIIPSGLILNFILLVLVSETIRSTQK